MTAPEAPMGAPFYGRDPLDVAQEAHARLSFVFHTVNGAWCRSRGCGHHISTHAEGRCYGQHDGADEDGMFTVGCRCRGYEERF